MPMWFYFDGEGNKKGPINNAQLQALANSNVINRETVLETEKGHKGKAGELKGLFPAPESNPFDSNESYFNTPARNERQAAVPPGSVFCTCCGKPISENAVACMSCGADPRVHRNFCRTCGAALNPNQVVCVRCGCAVSMGNQGRQVAGSSSVASTGCSKNKTTAGILAILLGGIGVHKFYMGSWGWGLIYVAAVLLTGFIAGFVTSLVALVEGIMWLVMSREDFENKYPDETIGPMRW